MTPSFRCRLLLAAIPLLLAACGGDGGGTAPTPAPVTPSAPPADTQAPTVSVSTTVSGEDVVLSATASDNVGVVSVHFLVDDDLVQGTVAKNSDGTWTLSVPLSSLAAGTHHVTAVALDAADNNGRATSDLTIIAPVATVPDTVPPVVTAAVEGNFGLVKLTAIATDDVRLDDVVFYVDGQSTGYRASGRYISTDPANQYFTLFDTTGLANGPHRVFARATDSANNHTDSAEVTFTVDSGAGMVESEPNDSIAKADVVPAGTTQIEGALTSVVTKLYVSPDSDYYKVSIPAGATLAVDMLSMQHGAYFVQLLDADGNTLSAAQETTASAVDSIRYANGAVARDAYIWVTSVDIDFMTRNQYKLSLSVH